MAAREGRRSYLVAIAASVLVLLVVQVVLVRDWASADPEAKASAGLASQVKSLKKKLARLQERVNTISKQVGPQGPQGPQGPAGAAPPCQGSEPADIMVAAGAVCIDRYEVSVWSSPTGGTQYGAGGDNYPCSDTGQDCDNIFARSVPGVLPSRNITWFQAQQALANVGKRLATNAEWQQAAAGTPDPGAGPGSEECNTDGTTLEVTGERNLCISTWGANDMVGNVNEWTADWGAQADSTCSDWDTLAAGFPDDPSCVGGTSPSDFPGVITRGGQTVTGGSLAGVFTVDQQNRPTQVSPAIGFRGAK